MKYTHRTVRITPISVLLLAAASITPLTASADGLLQVDQTVFGMDCAPCAYGIEQGLLKLKGVKQAHVDLNTGIASIELAPDNAVTLAEIQNVIRVHGFTPKSVKVTIAGKLEMQGQDYFLAINGVHEFRIKSSDPRLLSGLTADSEVTAEGSINTEGNYPLALLVTHIQPKPVNSAHAGK